MTVEDVSARTEIVAAGLELLSSGLVARTWGNVSCRAEGGFLISPSGLDYTKTTPEDIARVELPSMKWTGRRKPSSERGVHAAAYEIFPEAGFVVHSHQCCASALGLAGFETMDITEAERERLGGVALADYGPPGTKKLKNAVRAAMLSGARTVLMAHHGALVCGADKAEAMDRARLLEDVCRRNLAYRPLTPKRADAGKLDAVLEVLKARFPHAGLSDAPPVLEWARGKRPLTAQLDDMAQMLGRRVGTAPLKAERIARALEKRGAVLVPGAGAFVRAESADDLEALKLLTEKSAVAALHTRALGVPARLSAADCALMRFVYVRKYSKMKDGAA